MSKPYEVVIGLEVHLQLNTASKNFCGCANQFGEEPNSQTCPVCLGLPGSLPVLNKKALQYAIKVAMALNCTINPLIKFDRKNYYYPDLPKGYQISQYDLPIANNGFLLVTTSAQEKKFGIHRAHLEEDAGKLIHDTATNTTLVDYNRAGTPLMEIVTEPNIRSSQEAYDYLTTLKLTLQYLDVSDCDMEKGSLRCDANISVREKGHSKLGTKTEIKNLNSFKAVKSALDYEAERQIKELDNGQKITQETRLWNDEEQVTISMRSKEEAHDYRYFPEPDLVPFIVEEKELSDIRRSLPEMPMLKFKRFKEKYEISDYDAQILIQSKSLANFFESCLKNYSQAKKVCNWMIGPLLQELNLRKTTIESIRLSPKDLVALIEKVENGVLSNLAGKNVLKCMIEENKSSDTIIQEKGLVQVSDEATLETIVDEVIKTNQKIASQIKDGKENAIGFLIGQAMRQSKGKANPKIIGDIIKRRLKDV